MSDTSVKKRRGRPRKNKEETGKVEIKVAKMIVISGNAKDKS